jgi:hypothetical protein
MTNEPPRELYVELDFYDEEAECWSAFTTRVGESTKYILASRVEKMIRLAVLEADQRWSVLIGGQEDHVTAKEIKLLREELQ